MAFDWKDFLAFAKVIQKNQNEPDLREAALRTVVSRAYYAAFRLAVECGTQHGYIRRYSGDDHRNIQRFFRNIGREQGPRIARELQRLQDYRRRVDYENDLNQPPDSLAVWSIGMADRIVNALEDLSGTQD